MGHGWGRGLGGTMAWDARKHAPPQAITNAMPIISINCTLRRASMVGQVLYMQVLRVKAIQSELKHVFACISCQGSRLIFDPSSALHL